MERASSSEFSSSSPATEKNEPSHRVEVVHTNERVPGHDNYYEKDGLRTYGDDEDHDHEPPVHCSSYLQSRWEANMTGQMSFKRIMSLVAMAFLWVGSQIPVYIFGMSLASTTYPRWI